MVAVWIIPRSIQPMVVAVLLPMPHRESSVMVVVVAGMVKG